MKKAVGTVESLINAAYRAGVVVDVKSSIALNESWAKILQTLFATQKVN